MMKIDIQHIKFGLLGNTSVQCNQKCYIEINLKDTCYCKMLKK